MSVLHTISPENWKFLCFYSRRLFFFLLAWFSRIFPHQPLSLVALFSILLRIKMMRTIGMHEWKDLYSHLLGLSLPSFILASHDFGTRYMYMCCSSLSISSCDVFSKNEICIPKFILLETVLRNVGTQKKNNDKPNSKDFLWQDQDAFFSSIEIHIFFTFFFSPFHAKCI